MIVKSLTLRELPPSPDMWIRPLGANYTQEDINRFDNVTQGGVLIDKNTLSGVASNILKPSSDVTAMANISQGWGGTRFMFVMEVDIERRTGSISTEIVSGYTNYMGVNATSGSVDPNMEFYINNHVTIAQNVVNYPQGTMWVPMLTGNNQVFTPANVNTPSPTGHFMGEQMSTQRPVDLFTVPQIDSVISNVMAEHGQLAPNTASSFGHESVKLSRRDNLSASNYLSSALESQRSARKAADYLGNNESDLLSEAARNVSEHLIENNGVMRNLFRETNFMTTGQFLYSDLMALDTTGNLDSRVNVFFTDNRNQSIQQYAYNRDNCDGWTGKDNATVIGLNISAQLPGILGMALVNDCTFSATNYTPNGQMVVAVETVNMLFPANSGIDQKVYYDKLVHQLQMMLAAEATSLGGAIIDIKAVASTTNSIRMDISIDGEAPVPKFYPVFSDASVSFMLNDSMDKVKMLSSDIVNLSEATDAKMNNNLGLNLGSSAPISGFGGPQDNHSFTPPQQSHTPGWGLQVSNQPSQPAAPISNNWGFSNDPLPQ